MGFSNEDVTDDDRKRAAEISYDMGLAYAGAEEEGKDSGAAAERELAYHIGLIRAQEREKFAKLLHQCIPHIESNIESIGSELDCEHSHTAAQRGIAAAIDDATNLMIEIQLLTERM